MIPAPNERVVWSIIGELQPDEGGVQDVGDGMGVTHYGQTDTWLQDYGLPTPTSPEMAAANWRTWLHTTQLDVLTGIDQPLAHAVIDWAVMSGVVIPVRALQAAVRAKQDGVLGPETFAAVLHADPVRIAHVLLERRREAYLQLVKDNPAKNLTYLLGWNARITRELAEVHGITF